MEGQFVREFSKKTLASTSTPAMVQPILRLRGGAGGDEEKWLCETCDKLFVSKRNLDLHMSSAHANHDFHCVKSHEGVIKWKCNLCCNLLSSKQRIITHLITTHGKTNLCEHGHRQTLQSRSTLWRRKRTADGSFANEQCSSKSHFQEGSPSNFNSCPVSDYESLVPDSSNKGYTRS